MSDPKPVPLAEVMVRCSECGETASGAEINSDRTRYHLDNGSMIRLPVHGLTPGEADEIHALFLRCECCQEDHEEKPAMLVCGFLLRKPRGWIRGLAVLVRGAFEPYGFEVPRVATESPILAAREWGFLATRRFRISNKSGGVAQWNRRLMVNRSGITYCAG